MKVQGIAEGVAADVARGVRLRTRREEAARPEDMLSTGSTLLNLAMSGTPGGGFVKGKYFFIVGDSKTGKTWLSMTCLAEAARNPAYADYKFVFDDNEGGALMDVGRFFGEAVERRLQRKHSDTIEEFYDNVDDLVKRGERFIYVLDSMDGLSSEDEEKKYEEHKAARRAKKKGDKAPRGSYGDGKAKKNAQGLRRLKSGLRRTKSILIIISQTRDNPAAGPFMETKTRSGGRALRFYACCEFWSSNKGQITKKVRGRTRRIGARTRVDFKKNRITGREDSVTLSFYPSYGLDDVGSCVDFMVEEGFWKKEGSGMIRAKELGVKAGRDKLIRECEGRPRALVRAVTRAWKKIVEETSIQRRRRYV